MAEAEKTGQWDERTLTVGAAVLTGEIWQLPSGRPGALNGNTPAASGAVRTFRQRPDSFIVPKAVGAWLDGGPVWWDRSASQATGVPPLSDRDFFLGCASGDATEAATIGAVELGRWPAYEIDLHRSGGRSAVVKTAGGPLLAMRGGTLAMELTTDAEAQKLDWLSKRAMSVDAVGVLDATVEVVTNCTAAVGTLFVGVASGTDAADIESVANLAGFKLKLGTDLNIYAESDDGTTDVNPTDTLQDWAVGTPVNLAVDWRDKASVKFHVNGVRVLSGTTFTMTAAAGPLYALVWLAKAANASPGAVAVDRLTVRTAEQRG
jgi:hypothetical protein